MILTILRKSKLLWVFILFGCLTLMVAGCGNTSTTTSTTTKSTISGQSAALLSTSQSAPTSPQVNGTLQVHFIDVGQADSILIKSSADTAILIDGGNGPDGPNVVNYLKSQQVKELTAVIATHPHEDHIGGLAAVIKSFPVKAVYLPNASTTTKTFDDFISAVTSSGAKRIQAKAGVTLDVPGLKGQFLAPSGSGYEDLNNYSAVLSLTFGNIVFLFTGDAEEISENEMLKTGQNVKADVLKVGHHGSSSSTSSAFLKAVSPKYAIISVGADNDYGHPTESTLLNLSGAGVRLFRTDQEGTIVATCDGETVTFNKGSYKGSNEDSNEDSNKGSVSIAVIDLAGEAVTLVNHGASEVNLTGWKLVSEKGNQTYDFPSGTTIPAGGSLKVLSGPNATANTGVLEWTKSQIWNNDGDPGILYDAKGQVVSRK